MSNYKMGTQMALSGTLWVITVYNRAVLDKTQFQIIFLKAMGAIALNLESTQIFFT